jgi:hypothetical protein
MIKIVNTTPPLSGKLDFHEGFSLSASKISIIYRTGIGTHLVICLALEWSSLLKSLEDHVEGTQQICSVPQEIWDCMEYGAWWARSRLQWSRYGSPQGIRTSRLAGALVSTRNVTVTVIRVISSLIFPCEDFLMSGLNLCLVSYIASHSKSTKPQKVEKRLHNPKCNDGIKERAAGNKVCMYT